MLNHVDSIDYMLPNGVLIKYRFKSKMLTWRRVAGERGIDWFDFLVFWKVREHVIKTCILSGQSAMAFISPSPLAVRGFYIWTMDNGHI